MADTRTRSKGASSGAPEHPGDGGADPGPRHPGRLDVRRTGDARGRAPARPRAPSRSARPARRAGRWSTPTPTRRRAPAARRWTSSSSSIAAHGAGLAVGLAVADVERAVVATPGAPRRPGGSARGGGSPSRPARAPRRPPLPPQVGQRRLDGAVEGRVGERHPGQGGRGDRACTAVASIESTSPPIGPTDVAPTRCPAARSSTSLIRPSPPGPVIQPRVDSASGASPTRDVEPGVAGLLLGEADRPRPPGR